MSKSTRIRINPDGNNVVHCMRRFVCVCDEHNLVPSTQLLLAAPEMLFFVKTDAEGRCLDPDIIRRHDDLQGNHYENYDCGGCRTCKARALLNQIEGGE